MNEVRRTPNANKLYNRVLECENDFKQLYNSGFKLINLNSGLDEYFRIRSKLRCTFERLIVDEVAFSKANSFDLKLWQECYDKPINWIQSEINSEKRNILNLRRLRSILISFLDEGSTFFQLLLRSPSLDESFKYNFTVYSAILLRHREHFNANSSGMRAFNVLQDAITSEPFRGFGYFVLARWTLKDGDHLLAMYWALMACNVYVSENCFDFLKELSRSIITSLTDDSLSGQLLQMAGHLLIGQLTGNSHLKHLDLLSHSRMPALTNEVDGFKTLKYAIVILWMILGTEGLFPQSSVSQAQSCLLAKLFQFHSQNLDNLVFRNVWLAFGSNPNYSKLFTGNNYKTLSKINNFAYESLNSLLTAMIKKYPKEAFDISENVYLDFLALKSFSNVKTGNILDYFHESGGLLHLQTGYDSNQSNEFILSCTFEKNKKTEKSMKLLTHRFLASKLESLESAAEPKHLPWTIPDYPALLRQFQKIKKLCLARELRILITLPVLQELDFNKTKGPECREIIRFIHERLDASDPCIKLDDSATTTNVDISNYKRLTLNHWKIVREYYKNHEFGRIKIICSDQFEREFLIEDFGIESESIFNEI